MPEPSFSDFYQAELPQLLRFLVKQGATWEESWDAAQDAFLEAYRRWDSIAYPRAYIRTTGWRAYVHRRQRAVEDVRRATGDLDWLPRPCFADLQLGEGEALVLAALAGLPERQRQVMAWCYDGYSPKETAAILGLTSDAVRQSLSEARRSLRQTLGGMLAQSPGERKGGRA